MTERARQSKWFGIVGMCVFVALFIWLPWFSGFWPYRWTGFCFGIAVILRALPTAAERQRQLDFQNRYDIPRRVSLLGGVASLALGAIVMKNFLFGPGFFSGIRGRGDDGFIGVVLLASAAGSAYSFWQHTRGAANTNLKDPTTTLNHGEQ